MTFSGLNSNSSFQWIPIMSSFLEYSVRSQTLWWEHRHRKAEVSPRGLYSGTGRGVVYVFMVHLKPFKSFLIRLLNWNTTYFQDRVINTGLVIACAALVLTLIVVLILVKFDFVNLLALLVVISFSGSHLMLIHWYRLGKDIFHTQCGSW